MSPPRPPAAPEPSTRTAPRPAREASGPAERPCLADPLEKCAILGVSQVMSQVHGASVLVHGPKGCAFPAYEATLGDRLAFNFTEMCERSVIFGGEERLRSKLLDTYYEHLPAIVSIVTTCSSEIIGDDVLGVVTQSDLPVPVLRMEGVGFKRGHRQGAEHAMLELVRCRTQGVRRKGFARDGSINLIAHVGAGVRWKDEVVQLEQELRMLGRPVRRLFCDNVLADFDAVPRADLNVLVAPDLGQEVARELERRFGTPFVAPGLPVGLEQTVRWLGAIAERLGLNPAAALDREADAVRSRFRDGLGRVTTFRPLEALRALSTTIVADPATALAYHHFLHHELGLPARHVIVKAREAGRVDLGPSRTAYPETAFHEVSDYHQVAALLRDAAPELLLGNDIELLFARRASAPLYLNVAYPGARRAKLTSRPYLGFGGVLFLAEDLLNALVERTDPPTARSEA
jgi:nitrogenase molybdenum-iron protein beta chain